MNPLYEIKWNMGIDTTPTYIPNKDCKTKLRNLFEHMPLKTGSDPDAWTEEMESTKPCDALMPYLKRARLLVHFSKAEGATSYQAIYENKHDLERMIRKELYRHNGFEYYWTDFWSYR